MYEYIRSFQKMGFGLFVHFGLYSVLGKGEWSLAHGKASPGEYNALAQQFAPAADWAVRLARTARQAGCKYITLTTRHHDGFSLYDTRGLSDFDAPHSACGRDLVREFAEACRSEGIVPFFYHTLLDWHHPDYEACFPKYIDYLVKSIEVLCTNYGPVGGFWFDGMWDKKEDWQEDRLYGTIRRLQPQAMIINNTGLDALGKTGHPEIDSVTFERGKPFPVCSEGKPIAGEVCQVITDHWGYAQDDICIKSTRELLESLIDCRACGCNLLLNAGVQGNGLVTPVDEALLLCLGKWIDVNKRFIYNAVPAQLQGSNADIVTDGACYYAIIKDVPMSGNLNVARTEDSRLVALNTDKKIKNALWLDSGEPVQLQTVNSFYSQPFAYGTSLCARVARFELAD